MSEPSDSTQKGRQDKEQPEVARDESRATKQKPTRAEIVLGLVALAVVVGWILKWYQRGFAGSDPLYAALSFFGALAVVVFITLKPFGLVSLPPRVERYLLPVVSLLPVLGFLIANVISSLHEFLIITGSIALAYCSAITYWRKQFLELAGKKLGAHGKEEEPEDRREETMETREEAKQEETA